jgi:hypothetical protein
MMLRMVATLMLSSLAFDAGAAVRYLVANMSCAEVQQALERDGAAVLYRKGKSGVALYDRFVGDSSACPAGGTTTREGVAVADTDDCRLMKCIDARRFGGK